MIIIYALTLHFIADFVLQTREMAQKKSQEAIWLIRHLLVQLIIIGLGLCFVAPWQTAWKIAILNAIIHGLIDWNIWKMYKHFALKRATADFKYYEDYWFYVTIGLDQLLHTSTLVMLCNMLRS